MWGVSPQPPPVCNIWCTTTFVYTMRLLAWQSMKPDLFYPNVKYVYTVWIIPYPLYSAICAIHRTENTENTNLCTSEQSQPAL